MGTINPVFKKKYFDIILYFSDIYAEILITVVNNMIFYNMISATIVKQYEKKNKFNNLFLKQSLFQDNPDTLFEFFPLYVL